MNKLKYLLKMGIRRPSVAFAVLLFISGAPGAVGLRWDPVKWEVLAKRGGLGIKSAHP